MSKPTTATHRTVDNVIQFRPAVRQNLPVFIGLAGGTGSGKTKSALRLARGMVGPTGKIAAVDTEGRRMSTYADTDKFEVFDIEPPFRPHKFMDAAKRAEEQGYDVLVIDSMSHEWTGDGGVVEWHDEELDRAVVKAQQREGHDLSEQEEERIRGANNMKAWIKPKGEHKLMVQSFLQRKIPIVFCFRAEEKVKVLGNGKVEPMGWTPLGDSRFMFELTTLLTLSNEEPGSINYKLPRKINEQHQSIFRDGMLITEDMGAKLIEWAKGGGEQKKEPVRAAKSPETNTAPPMEPHSGQKKKAEAAPSADEVRIAKGVDDLIKRYKGTTSGAEFDKIGLEKEVQKQVGWLYKNNKPQHKRLFDEIKAHRATLPMRPR
jgi:hypothetical protein